MENEYADSLDERADICLYLSRDFTAGVGRLGAGLLLGE